MVPYFFSDLADWTSMEYVGPGSGDAVIRGSLDDGDFTAFYVDPDSGKVTAALTVGRSDDLEHAKRFIARRARRRTAAALADESTDLALAAVSSARWPRACGGRDSNPDNQLQRLASCRLDDPATTPEDSARVGFEAACLAARPVARDAPFASPCCVAACGDEDREGSVTVEGGTGTQTTGTGTGTATATTPVGRGRRRRFEISETEFKLTPAGIRSSRSPAWSSSVVTNDGGTVARPRGRGADRRVRDRGDPAGREARRSKADVSEPGTYKLYCPVGDHEDRGMVGKLVVGGGSSGTSGGGDSGGERATAVATTAPATTAAATTAAAPPRPGY